MKQQITKTAYIAVVAVAAVWLTNKAYAMYQAKTATASA